MCSRSSGRYGSSTTPSPSASNSASRRFSALRRWCSATRKELPKSKHLAGLPYRDVPAFMPRLRARIELEARAVELLLLTAVRTGDLIGQRAIVRKDKKTGAVLREVQPAKPPMKWTDINWDEAVWEIPVTKTGPEKFPVPLSEQALALLKLVKSYGLAGERVFPIGKTDTPDLLQEIEPDYTVHGLRSAFKTWTDETHWSKDKDVVEACLSHIIPGKEAEAAYRRGTFLEKRRKCLTEWACYISAAPS